MICDMCGRENGIYRTIVESAQLNLCKDCSRFGRVTGTIRQQAAEKGIRQEEEQKKEVLEIVAEDFAEKIKRKREQLGLTQKDFAKKINEKESMVHKMETGSFTPPLNLARRLEKLLNLKLIESHEETHQKAKASLGSFTIGDFIKIKKCFSFNRTFNLA